MNRHSPEYIEYLKSDAWKLKRLSKIQSVGYKCQRCNATDKLLQVHHLTYDRLGHERMDDLKVVCLDCHEVEDVERKIQANQRHYSKAMDTYASKKYGEYWHDRRDSEQIQEEFDNWLERKRYSDY